jgi:redox-sensitive bicupin YhaK (pirin superfamily)
MIEIITNEKRNFTDHGWLKTYWLFSFSDYYDPENIRHGKLRVFNDDIVQAQTGFPRHPHEEMEIITIVLDGEMTHKDSMGNTITVKAGDVQRMSAGTGLFHSEWNYGDDPVHFFQVWIEPTVHEIPPSYDQKAFLPDVWKNVLYPVASGQKSDAVFMHTDAIIYRSELDVGHTINFESNSKRKQFLYVMSGAVELNGRLLNNHDQARVSNMAKISIIGRSHAEFIFIDSV